MSRRNRPPNLWGCKPTEDVCVEHDLPLENQRGCFKQNAAPQVPPGVCPADDPNREAKGTGGHISAHRPIARGVAPSVSDDSAGTRIPAVAALKPCPFCGSDALNRWIVADRTRAVKDNEVQGVQCENCGAHSLNAGLWNMRSAAVEPSHCEACHVSLLCTGKAGCVAISNPTNAAPQGRSNPPAQAATQDAVPAVAAPSWMKS